jgi:hypothetical protein
MGRARTSPDQSAFPCGRASDHPRCDRGKKRKCTGILGQQSQSGMEISAGRLATVTVEDTPSSESSVASTTALTSHNAAAPAAV